MDYANQVILALDSVLARGGACPSAGECYRQRLVTYAPLPLGGVAVNVHVATSPDVVGDLTAACARVVTTARTTYPIHLTVHTEEAQRGSAASRASALAGTRAEWRFTFDHY